MLFELRVTKIELISINGDEIQSGDNYRLHVIIRDLFSGGFVLGYVAVALRWFSYCTGAFIKFGVYLFVFGFKKISRAIG